MLRIGIADKSLVVERFRCGARLGCTPVQIDARAFLRGRWWLNCFDTAFLFSFFLIERSLETVSPFEAAEAKLLSGRTWLQ